MTSLGMDNAFTTGGKIGTNCAHLTKISGNISIPSMAGAKQMSFAYWVKVNNAWSTNWLDGIRWYSTNGSSDTTSRQEFYKNCTQIGVWFAGDPNSISISGKAFTVGVWHHLAFTIDYNSGNANFYIDGISVGTATGVNTGHYLKNGIFTIGDNGVDISMNDVRIYNHALSAKEVKEISQGLVLHYKLDKPNQNLLTNDWDLTTWNKESGISVEWDSNAGMYKVIDTTHTSSRWGIYQNITLTANTTYTFSVEGMKRDQNVNFGFAEGTSWPANNGSFTTTVSRLSHTITVGSADANCRIYLNINPVAEGSNYGYYRAPKLELGSITTNWSPNSDENIIQDSSGYNNNGTIVGTCTAVESPPRYSSTISMNNTSTTNHIETANDITFSDNMSVSFWVKSALSNQVIFASKYIEFGILNSLGYVNPSASAGYQLSSYFTANEWNHICVVKNVGTFTLYVNGQKPARNGANNNYLHNVDKLWILNRSYNSSYGGNGSVSDFRFYVTPLGDDDVLDLYHTSLSIDNLQNTHTFEFEEQDENVLAGIPWTSPYSTRNDTQNLFTNYNTNGEPQFTANGTSAGSKYIEITPGIYYYDTTISVNTGNQFYIGFERYDANKTTRENNACAYIYTTKPSSDVVKQRYKGTVNLSTDGTNTLKYITLRILNGWSGTTSGVTGQATVHNLSLRLVSDAQTPKIKRTGEFVVSELKEDAKSSLYKSDMVEAAEFIER